MQEIPLSYEWKKTILAVEEEAFSLLTREYFRYDDLNGGDIFFLISYE